MSKFKLTILIFLLLFFFISCEEKKKDNTAALAASFLLTSSSCTSSAATTISNTALGSTAPTATQYTISGCDVNSLSGLGFSSQNITTGVTGTSANSKIAANGDLFSANDVNIEVTFSITNSSGYLEVIGQGSGNAATIDGPTIRINSSSIEARGTGSGTLSNITNQSTVAGQMVTYCLEFHNESPNFHAVFWSSACTAVSTADKTDYTGREATTPSSFPGKRVGFILNNATLHSFIVRTKIGIAANLLEP